MIRVLLCAGLLYAAILAAGYAPGVLGLPFSAQPNFPADVEYSTSLDAVLPMRKAFRAFGVSPEYLKGGRPIVMGGQTADGGVIIQMLNPGVDAREWQRRVANGESALDESGGPIKTIYPDDGDVHLQGTAKTVFEGRKNVYAFDFEVIDGELLTKTPESCHPLSLRSVWLAAIGVTPSGVSYCLARGKNSRRAVLTFHAVPNGFLVPHYTDLTCALIHDAVASELGENASNLEHVCLGLRTNSLLVSEENPISVRHFKFS